MSAFPKSGRSICWKLAEIGGRFRPMLLKKSVLHQPQNSHEFFAPGPRRSLPMLQPLRRSWVDFHMTTTTPSYKEYKKSIRTQIKTRPRQEPTFSTALARSGRSSRTNSPSLPSFSDYRQRASKLFSRRDNSVLSRVYSFVTMNNWRNAARAAILLTSQLKCHPRHFTVRSFSSSLR